MSTETLPAKPASKSIAATVESPAFTNELQKCLASHMAPDRFKKLTLMAIRRNPKLADCTPASFFAAVLQLAQIGLEPDGRRAHLVPFFNKRKNAQEATAIADYKGLVELAMRSGLLSSLGAYEVCDKDQFDWENGQIKHRIDWRKDRGDAYAYYALATMKDGATLACTMSKGEINEVRARANGKDGTFWTDHYGEMAKKTVIRRLSKMLVLSAEFRDAEAMDDAEELPPETKPLVTVTDEPLPALESENPAETQGGAA